MKPYVSFSPYVRKVKIIPNISTDQKSEGMRENKTGQEEREEEKQKRNEKKRKKAHTISSVK